MSAKLTVGELLAAGSAQLRGAGEGVTGTADLDAQLLLSYVLAVPRARLKSHPESVPEAGAVDRYHGLLARRAAGEPLAYLTGYRHFWSLRLRVTPAVLIPRPETELLVERALALLPAAEARVADLGTGSGAVALAVASERPEWRVIATDLSEEALEVARANAARLGLSRVEFRRGDWYQPLAGERFDLIVSNPPYVAADDPAIAVRALAHEPRAALTPGADAFACLREIVRGASAHLAHTGWLLLEHGATQGAQLRHTLVLAGFRSVRSHRDLAGHERVTEGLRHEAGDVRQAFNDQV